MLLQLIQNKKLFRVGLGAMPLSIQNRPTQKKAMRVIETFVELGGNFIDTANVYGFDDAERGHNEILICHTLKKLNSKDDVLVATKGGATRPNAGWGLRGGHPKKLRAACENSLINLQTNEHSLYYLHGPDPDVPLADSISELANLKQEGKIRRIGIANVTLDELKLASNLTTITAVQNRCNPFCKADFTNGLIDYCAGNNIIYIPYCPLGGWHDHAKLATSDLYKGLTAKYNASSYLIALAWLLAKREHIVPIPGMDAESQIRQNFAALHLTLLPEDIAQLDAFPDLYSPKHLEP